MIPLFLFVTALFVADTILCNACIHPCVSDKTIRISEDTWRWLQDQKRSGESFDDVLSRLRSQDKWNGFGALADTGIAEGTAEAHERLEAELEGDQNS